VYSSQIVYSVLWDRQTTDIGTAKQFIHLDFGKHVGSHLIVEQVNGADRLNGGKTTATVNGNTYSVFVGVTAYSTCTGPAYIKQCICNL